MHSTVIHLHKGEDDFWAINLAGDIAEKHRAEKGFGNSSQKVWSLEIQSDEPPDYDLVDWDALLERAIYAYDMNDPLFSGFQWPLKTGAKK